ncbi:MAG: LON peptidase substrate-binding domain-containing protein [Actinomycetota bacterium]|nr:LON peptidase substrate-binding domain-containing protein [Actinomycetota bacterium]
MDARTIPLFPLHRVLLPGARLSLQVFEERYRLMMEQLEDQRFGVVLISDGSEVGEPARYHDVGTEGRIVHSQAFTDGRSVLLVEGERRFEVIERLSVDPYPLALVEYLPDEPAAWSALTHLRDEVERSLRRFIGLAVESGESGDVNMSISEDPVTASYEVASLMRISSPERQELLELPTAAARLERELAVLRREIGLLEHLLQIGRPR